MINMMKISKKTKPHRKKLPKRKRKLVMTSQNLKIARRKNSEVVTTSPQQPKKKPKKFRKKKLKQQQKLKEKKNQETPLAVPEPPADASPAKTTDSWYYELQYWEIP